MNRRYPRYPDDADYQTNAPSYYDDLARKNKLIKLLSQRIWEYDEELAKRFAEWDKNLEEFPEEVVRLLQEWMDTGVFDDIINEHIFADLNNKINVRTDYIFHPLEYRELNNFADNEEDFTNCINEAIRLASINGGIVQIPCMEMLITSTLFIPEGVTLRGVTIPGIWSTDYNGSVLIYRGTGNAVEIGTKEGKEVRNVHVHTLRIIDENNSGSRGLVIGQESSSGSSVDLKIERIVVEGFQYGFQVYRAYGIFANLCVSKNPRNIGWWFWNNSLDETVRYGGLTLSTFQSCGVYGDETITGFKIDRDISYSSFQQCYVDGCRDGFNMTGYTRNTNLFQNCGVESFYRSAWRITSVQNKCGLSGCFVTLPKGEELEDYIYFEGERLHLHQMELSYGYRPTNGFSEVNIATGRGHIVDCWINSIKGDYVGIPLNPNMMMNLPYPKNINAFNVEVTTENVSVNGSFRNNIIGTSLNSEYSMILTGGTLNQVITIYGKDDLNKLRLRAQDFIGLGLTTYLGSGDFVKVLRTEQGWQVLEKSIDRYSSTPPAENTGYWELGRKIWNTNTTTGNRLGWVCILSGMNPQWASFGEIYETSI